MVTEYPVTIPPRFGPRILFFSGGTALRETAHELTHHTHNAVHIVTPFDSGGSSAALRNAFDMPAVGDLRARIMALADDHTSGNPEVYTLFAYRLPKDASPRELKSEAAALGRGAHPLLRQIPQPVGGIIRQHLDWFMSRMPADFSLGGASVGNLVLAGGYLEGGRRLNPVIALFSRLVRARGVVRPVTVHPAHLAVRLASGEVLVGQHSFTGKETAAVSSPITKIWLIRNLQSGDPAHIAIAPHITRRILSAELICYPVGSFYSSLMANLLPVGVGRAVAAARCPKVFVPNLGVDPELAGQTVEEQVDRLVSRLVADAPGARAKDVLHTVLADPDHAYPGGIPEAALAAKGIRIMYTSLSREKRPMADSRFLSRALLSLVRQ